MFYPIYLFYFNAPDCVQAVVEYSFIFGKRERHFNGCREDEV